MARKRRRIDPRSPLAQRFPEWRWRTLPVWLALTGGFVLGWYVAAIGTAFQPDRWSYFTLLAVLALFSFGLSRVITRVTAMWLARRRTARDEKRILSEPATRRSRSG
jgi:uncharacterized membrane protein YcjF (UPF0283 family)